MDFEVIWTDFATDNLQAVFDYIAKDNPSAAERTVQRIVKRIESLKGMPFLGSIYSRAKDPRIREILSGKYRIFYRVIDPSRRVEILLIWHSARMEPRL